MSPRLASCLWLAVFALAAGCCHTAPFCGDTCATPCGTGCLTDHLTCGAGCGELYVDEWLSDPPCGEPCDGCGNFTGHGHDHHLFGLVHALWGYRYAPSGCGPAASYHGYAAAAGYPHDETAYAEEYAGHSTGSIGAMARAPAIGDDFYEVGPGESVVPGSVKITEGGVVGEPTPAPTTAPLPAPHDLPGPSAAKPRPKPRTATHRQTGFSGRPARPLSPRQRPKPSLGL